MRFQVSNLFTSSLAPETPTKANPFCNVLCSSKKLSVAPANVDLKESPIAENTEGKAFDASIILLMKTFAVSLNLEKNICKPSAPSLVFPNASPKNSKACSNLPQQFQVFQLWNLNPQELFHNYQH